MWKWLERRGRRIRNSARIRAINAERSEAIICNLQGASANLEPHLKYHYYLWGSYRQTLRKYIKGISFQSYRRRNDDGWALERYWVAKISLHSLKWGEKEHVVNEEWRLIPNAVLESRSNDRNVDEKQICIIKWELISIWKRGAEDWGIWRVFGIS